MVDAAVAHTFFFHAADDAFKGFQIFAGVSVQLHIADMARVCKGMIGSFQMDLFIRPDGEVYGDMEGICVIFPIRDPGDFSEFLLLLILGYYRSNG